MKCKGSLTVEATLLFIILLSVMGTLITLGVVFQKNMQLYSEVESSANQVALYYYGIQRVSGSLTDDGKAFSSDDTSSLGNLLLGYGKKGAATVSAYAYADMVKFGLTHKYGGRTNFNQRFWLKDVPEVIVTPKENCILIDVKKKFKVASIIPIIPEITFSDRHLIPIKSSVSIITGYGSPKAKKVHVTNNGKTDSHVYHVYKDCFAGKSATRGFFDYKVIQAEIGSDLTLDGQAYHICPFCAKKLGSGE